MTIREFIEILEEFEDDTKDIFVAMFKLNGTGECFEIEGVGDNNGHVQLEIIEEGVDYDNLRKPKRELN